MNVVIRVDASLVMGTGHVMRCLTLANSLRRIGANVEFICRKHVGNLISAIEDQGFIVHALDKTEVDSKRTEQCVKAANPRRVKEQVLMHAEWLGASQQVDAQECCLILKQLKVDWLIIDHYGIDQAWQLLSKEFYKKLMVIDDLGDRHHYCDLLLDQNYGSSVEKYQFLVPSHCQILIGPQYALLRPEFEIWREYSLKRRLHPEFKKILITLGGVDNNNVTGEILTVLEGCALPKTIEIVVVLGATAPYIDLVKVKADALPYKVQVKVNVNNMSEVMAGCDLVIGAAGATTWERCCLGVPSVQIVIAENQKETALALEKNNIVRVIKQPIELVELLKTPLDWMLETSQTSLRLCDGQGCLRVVKQLIG